MSDYFLNKIYDSLISRKPVPKKPEPIVEKKSFKPLSKVYEVLLREVEHVAVYGSQQDVNPKNIPDRTEQGLETLGVVSKDVADRWKRQANLETVNVATLIENLFKLKKLPSKKQKPDAFTVFYNALETANIQNTYILFQILSTPEGQFDALNLQPYNCIESAIATIQSHPLAKKTSIDTEALKTLLTELLPQAPEMASTATGPGELYYSIFSNATLAKEKGSKSGDLLVNGKVVEAKASSESGARLGGDGSANDALKIIPQKLLNLNKGYVNRDQFVLKGLNKILSLTNNIKNTSFENFKKDIRNILNRYNFNKVNLSQINRGSLPVEKFKSNILDFNTPVNKDFDLLTSQRATQIEENFFINRYRNYINTLIELLQQKIDFFTKTQRPHTTDELDLLLYDTINFIKKNQPEISYEELIDYIVLIRNERDAEQQVRAELKQMFRDVNSIFQFAQNAENLEKLVGAIHLYAYTLITKPDYYLLLNTQFINNNNNSFVFEAPKNLKDSLLVASTPGISFDTRVDSGKTKYAKAVNIVYTPQ